MNGSSAVDPVLLKRRQAEAGFKKALMADDVPGMEAAFGEVEQLLDTEIEALRSQVATAEAAKASWARKRKAIEAMRT